MAYDHEFFIRMAHDALGIPYDPVWPDAEACLNWWQRIFADWLINRNE